MRWAYTMPVCVLFVSSRSGIVFNPSAGAITDHCQSVKDIDPYFKSQLYVENPVPALCGGHVLTRNHTHMHSILKVKTVFFR